MPVAPAAARAAYFAFFLALVCAVAAAAGAFAWTLQPRHGLGPFALAAFGLMGTVAWISHGLTRLRPAPLPPLRPELSERYHGQPLPRR